MKRKAIRTNLSSICAQSLGFGNPHDHCNDIKHERNKKMTSSVINVDMTSDVLNPKRCRKLTGGRDNEFVWVDRNTLSAVVRLIDAYQVVS